MNNLFALIVIAMFIEAFISYAQTVYTQGRIQWQIVLAFIIGAAVCYDTEVNFFSIVGLSEKFPIIGIIATAVVVCRGSNYLFEFYNSLAGWRKKADENVALGLKKPSNKDKEKKTINFVD